MLHDVKKDESIFKNSQMQRVIELIKLSNNYGYKVINNQVIKFYQDYKLDKF